MNSNVSPLPPYVHHHHPSTGFSKLTLGDIVGNRSNQQSTFILLPSLKIGEHKEKSPRANTKSNRRVRFASQHIGTAKPISINASDPDIKLADTTKNDSWGISLSLFLTYLTVMGAKCALPSTLSLLTSQQSGLAHYNTVLSRQDIIRRLLALSTVSIAVGKLALGPIIDSLGGIMSLQIALSTLSICLGAIGLGSQTCPTLTTLTMYWIIVDFAFSSCWAACVKTIREYLDEKKWSREIGRLAMAARLGNAVSFAFFAWLLQWASSSGRVVVSNVEGAVNTSWRWVFRASSIVQLVPLLLLSYYGKAKSVGENDNTTSSSTVKNQTKRKSQSTFKQSLDVLRTQSRTPEFWLHLVSRSIIMVLVSFLLFIPTYMVQCFEMSSSSSARVGSVFALGCLLSVSTLSERTYPPSTSTRNSNDVYKRKSYSMLSFLSLSTICLMLQTAYLQNRIPLSPMLGMVLMFLFGFSLAIPFYLPSSMFALKRGKEGSATIADAFDVCGFGMLAVFNGLVARVLDVSGDIGLKAGAMLLNRKRAWLPVFGSMCGGSVVAMISLYFAVRLEGARDVGTESKG